MESIPVIDISAFRAGDAEGAARVVDAVRRACEDNGFFIVTGHGVSEGLVKDVIRDAETFFGLPFKEKLRIEKPAGPNYKGYTPVRGRTVGRSRNPDLKPSLNESFAMGRHDVTDDEYFRTPAAGAHFDPNVFPEQPASFRENITAYYRAMEQLSADILRIFARALDMPESYFLEKITRQISVLRLVNYPVLDRAADQGEERAGAHSDTGAITILRIQDPPGQPGLQVRRPDGSWLNVYSVPEAFVINIGDTMMRWTNDRFVSTMHRVATPATDEARRRSRLSIPFFCQPNYEAVIECVPTCATAQRPAQYSPITSGEVLTNRYTSSYSLDKTATAAA